MLKLILAGLKKLLPLADLCTLPVLKYDELSMRSIYAAIKKDPLFLVHFPDSYPRATNLTAPTMC